MPVNFSVYIHHHKSDLSWTSYHTFNSLWLSYNLWKFGNTKYGELLNYFSSVL